MPVGPGASYTFYGALSAVKTDEQSATWPPTALGFYKGGPTDTFDVLVTSNVEWSVINATGAGGGTVDPGTVDASVTVTYEVPEPATMSLLAIGGIAALIRRKK